MLRLLLFLAVAAYGGMVLCGQPAHLQRQLRSAVSSINAGQYDTAVRILRSILRRAPWYHEARYELSLALSMQQRFQEAVAECKVLCDSLNDTTKLREHYFQLLGNLLTIVGDTTAAEQYLFEGLRYFPRSARLRVELGIYYGRQGKFTLALRYIDTALCFDPKYAPGFFWRAQYSRLWGDRLGALLCSEIYSTLRPEEQRGKRMSRMWYELYREIVEDYDKRGHVSLLDSEQSTTSTVFLSPFAQAVANVFEGSLQHLRFNRDFELPIASIDTLLRNFIARWYRDRYHEKFPCVIFERYRQLDEKGLLAAYVHQIARYGKPLQYDAYAKTYRVQLRQLERWLAKHPLVPRCETLQLPMLFVQ